MRCYDKIASETDLVKICLTEQKMGLERVRVHKTWTQLPRRFRKASALAAGFLFIRFFSAFCVVVGAQLKCTASYSVPWDVVEKRDLPFRNA